MCRAPAGRRSKPTCVVLSQAEDRGRHVSRSRRPKIEAELCRLPQAEGRSRHVSCSRRPEVEADVCRALAGRGRSRHVSRSRGSKNEADMYCAFEDQRSKLTCVALSQAKDRSRHVSRSVQIVPATVITPRLHDNLRCAVIVSTPSICSSLLLQAAHPVRRQGPIVTREMIVAGSFRAIDMGGS